MKNSDNEASLSVNDKKIVTFLFFNSQPIINARILDKGYSETRYVEFKKFEIGMGVIIHEITISLLQNVTELQLYSI
jgi:hypothetical protein